MSGSDGGGALEPDRPGLLSELHVTGGLDRGNGSIEDARRGRSGFPRCRGRGAVPCGHRLGGRTRDLGASGHWLRRWIRGLSARGHGLRRRRDGLSDGNGFRRGRGSRVWRLRRGGDRLNAVAFCRGTVFRADRIARWRRLQGVPYRGGRVPSWGRGVRTSSVRISHARIPELVNDAEQYQRPGFPESPGGGGWRTGGSEERGGRLRKWPLHRRECKDNTTICNVDFTLRQRERHGPVRVRRRSNAAGPHSTGLPGGIVGQAPGGPTLRTAGVRTPRPRPARAEPPRRRRTCGCTWPGWA